MNDSINFIELLLKDVNNGIDGVVPTPMHFLRSLERLHGADDSCSVAWMFFFFFLTFKIKYYL